MNKKERLDKLVQEKFAHLTRNQVQGFIMQGKVKVDGVALTKSGTPVLLEAVITLDEQTPEYVCRAGYKLAGALDHFEIIVADKTVLDAGLSTGGFTDCLLQRGAKKVFGIDVGYGQVHEKIRIDKRVEVLERTNLRYLKTVGELVDLVTLDLSFISVLKVMHTVVSVLKSGGILIVLIKPQFEARREQVGKGGIIKDDQVHKQVIEEVTAGIIEHNFKLHGVVLSSIEGKDGNKEFLAYFEKQ